MTIIFLLVGLGLIVLGADWLVDGASAIARRLGVSEFVIGSNIFNALFILGITAVILPVSMTDENRKRDIPVTLEVSVILVLFGMSKTLLGIGGADVLSRMEGIGFLILFCVYLYFCFKFDSKERTDMSQKKQMQLPLAILAVVAGLAGLIFGGELFVDSATDLAKRLGVSDKFIAITILAGGTSFPELATCIVAAAKHKDQLALGNILGSNVFNILLILGCSAVITPLSFGGMSLVDVGILIASCVLLLLWAYSGRKCCIDRWEGAVMLLLFAAYYSYLFVKL